VVHHIWRCVGELPPPLLRPAGTKAAARGTDRLDAKRSTTQRTHGRLGRPPLLTASGQPLAPSPNQPHRTHEQTRRGQTHRYRAYKPYRRRAVTRVENGEACLRSILSVTGISLGLAPQRTVRNRRIVLHVGQHRGHVSLMLDLCVSRRAPGTSHPTQSPTEPAARRPGRRRHWPTRYDYRGHDPDQSRGDLHGCSPTRTGDLEPPRPTSPRTSVRREGRDHDPGKRRRHQLDRWPDSPDPDGHSTPSLPFPPQGACVGHGALRESRP